MADCPRVSVFRVPLLALKSLESLSLMWIAEKIVMFGLSLPPSVPV
jgi:hypothetical protein